MREGFGKNFSMSLCTINLRLTLRFEGTKFVDILFSSFPLF